MHALLNKFLRKPSLDVAERSALLTSDVPRYPPFTEGFPRFTSKDLLASQKALITEIFQVLRFTEIQFEHLVIPVIENYASYVHLLPASERHHHRGMGGLFRHGLEVGKIAAQFCLANQFCANDLPKDRSANESRWQYACFVAGLTHDLGKPLSDLCVRDKSGGITWNPYELSLVEWLYDGGIERYFIAWTPDRNKKHKNFSLLIISKILTGPVSAYINANGPVVMNALLESLVGNSAIGSITSIVMEADGASTSRDLANARMDVDEFSYGVPIERFFFDALRTYVSGSSVNSPGSTIWVVTGSLFLSWPRVADDIYQIIQSDKIPGFPKSADSLADILLERGYASYSADDNGVSKRYWTIYPECLGGLSLNCLRLDDLNLVFAIEPPPGVNASIGVPPISVDTYPQLQAVKPKLENLSAEKLVADTPTQSQVNTEPHRGNDLQDSIGNNQRQPAKSVPSARHLDLSGDVEQKQGHQSKQTTKEIAGSASVDHATNADRSVPESNDITKPNPAKNPTKKILPIKVSQNDRVETLKKSPRPIDAAVKDLLEQVIKKSREGIYLVEKIADGSFGILYPARVNELGKAQDVLNCLKNSGALKMQSGLNTATQRVDGKTYLILAKPVKRLLLDMGYIFGEAANGQSPLTMQTHIPSERNTHSHNKFSTPATFDHEIDLRKQPSHPEFTVEIVRGVECLVLGPKALLDISRKIHEPIISVKMKLMSRIDYHSDNKKLYYLKVKL